jgi:hypothetical protein
MLHEVHWFVTVTFPCTNNCNNRTGTLLNKVSSELQWVLSVKHDTAQLPYTVLAQNAQIKRKFVTTNHPIYHKNPSYSELMP